MEKFARLISMAPFFLLLCLPFALAGHDYGQALSKSILFFEAQRSGYLPHNQRVTWRSNSGLNDGKASGVSLKPHWVYVFFSFQSLSTFANWVLFVILQIYKS
jgi:hypothetical protein